MIKTTSCKKNAWPFDFILNNKLDKNASYRGNKYEKKQDYVQGVITTHS